MPGCSARPIEPRALSVALDGKVPLKYGIPLISQYKELVDAIRQDGPPETSLTTGRALS